MEKKTAGPSFNTLSKTYKDSSLHICQMQSGMYLLSQTIQACLAKSWAAAAAIFLIKVGQVTSWLLPGSACLTCIGRVLLSACKQLSDNPQTNKKDLFFAFKTPDRECVVCSLYSCLGLLMLGVWVSSLHFLFHFVVLSPCVLCRLPLSLFFSLHCDCLPRPDSFHLGLANLPCLLLCLACLLCMFTMLPSVPFAEPLSCFLPLFSGTCLIFLLDYVHLPFFLWALLDCLEWHPGFDPCLLWTSKFLLNRFRCYICRVSVTSLDSLSWQFHTRWTKVSFTTEVNSDL